MEPSQIILISLASAILYFWYLYSFEQTEMKQPESDEYEIQEDLRVSEILGKDFSAKQYCVSNWHRIPTKEEKAELRRDIVQSHLSAVRRRKEREEREKWLRTPEGMQWEKIRRDRDRPSKNHSQESNHRNDSSRRDDDDLLDPTNIMSPLNPISPFSIWGD